MKKIKVMHFVSGLVSGGVEQMLINYCNNMDHDKFEFIVVYQHEPVQICIDKIKDAGCKTIRITARNENFFKNITDSFKVIKKYKPDIVHSHMNLMNFCCLLPAYILGVKVRISHSHIAEKQKSTLYKIGSLICKILIKLFSNVFLACGEDAGKYLYGSKTKFKIINNAIDLDSFKYKGDNLRNSLNLQEKVIIGHVGRFTKQKNHKRLINIFKEFLSVQSEAILLLAGTGELEQEIKRYVSELNISDNVIFLGPVLNMNKFYSSLNLFILPSLFEGFPVVALETQAAGVISLYSDNIDKNIKITDLVHLLSLKNSDVEWARKMNELLETKYKKDFNIQLTEAGYNIKKESEKLEKIYLDTLNDYL